MITPKGKFAHIAPSIEVYRPFLSLGLICIMTVIVNDFLRKSKVIEAQTFFALSNSVFMLTICVVDLSIRLKAAKPKLQDLRADWIKPLTIVWSFVVLFFITSIINFYTIYSHAEAESKNLRNSTLLNTEDNLSYKQKISSLPVNSDIHPKFGIYEQNPSIFSATKMPIIQHEFIDWRNDEKLAKRIYEIEDNKNTPLITIEPKGEPDGQKLLEDIVSGKYDAQLNNIADVLKNSKSPVYIRFAHEMELSDLYPWGNQNPDSYIEAYRHVYTILKSVNPANVKMVWSPAGNDGAEIYYPGDEYVDVIGVTMLHDQYWYGQESVNFYDIAASRQWVKYYQKPKWIVEFGAGHSTPEIQKNIIAQAKNEFYDYGYSALIYLNTFDANISGPDYHINRSSDFLPAVQ